MRTLGIRSLLATLSVSAAFCGGAATSSAAVGDPGFVFTGSGFEAPCGIAVDVSGNFYVSSYYTNDVSIYSTNRSLVTRLTEEDPENGPCGLATDAQYNLYINNFHKDVLRLPPSGTPITAGVKYGAPFTLSTLNPTGVAVDSGASRVYINNRTHVSVYDTLGGVVLHEGQPLVIGQGLIEDGFGLAAGGGLVYVPDAGSDTVKVFNSNGIFVTEFGGPVGPFPGFNSLRDSAIAIDRVRGTIYVADHLGSFLTERPESVIHVFDQSGVYEGRLKFNVIDPGPVGLAVDNSAGVNQGRVYVSSGNTEKGSVYGYPPDSAVASGLPATMSLSLASVGSGSGAVVASSGAGFECDTSCSEAAFAGEEVTLTARPAPLSTFVGWSGGGCSGAGSCTVTMSEARSISGEFATQPSPQIPAVGAARAGPSAAGTPTVARKRKAHKKKAKHRRGPKRHAKKRRAGHRR